MGSSFRTFIDFGTTVAFLVAPVIAVLNYRAVFGPAMPPAARPGRGMWSWSLAGIVSFAAFPSIWFALPFGGYQ